MPNSKQINELNQASSVNSTDQLPLAQSGSNEAVRATISQLASAVGELNQTGALSELELATSLGKNLLAQNLTEKGIPTSPSETLISMADKVNNLQLDSNKELLISGLTISEEQIDYNNSSGYGYAASCCLLNGYTAVISHNKLYFCNTEGEYSDMASILSQALNSINIGIIDKSIFIKTSPNKEYVCIFQRNVASDAEIYRVDYTNKTFVFYKSLNLPAAYNEKGSVAINNDASMIVWVSGSSSNAHPIIASVNDPTIYTTVTGASYEGNRPVLMFDNGLSQFYYFSGTGGSSYLKIWCISYFLSGSTIQTSQVYYHSSLGWGLMCPNSYKNTCMIPQSYASFGTDYYQMSMTLVNLRNFTYSNTLTIVSPSNNLSSVNSSSSSSTYMIGGMYDCPFTIQGDLTKYHVAVPSGYIVYNSSTNSLTFEPDGVIDVFWPTNLFCWTYGSSSPYVEYWSSAPFFDIRRQHAFLCNYGGCTTLKILTLRPQQIYGIKRIHNNYTQIYKQTSYPVETIQRGEYDVQTADIILPEESDESN